MTPTAASTRLIAAARSPADGHPQFAKAALDRARDSLGLLGELPEFRAEINTEFDRGAPVVGWCRGCAPLWQIPGVAGAAARPAEIYYATTVAGYQRARLNDGSTIELNSASALRVQFTAAARHVKIETGEAHFDVAHDAARPFVVRAGDVFVRAVGTSFNVRLAPDGGVEGIVNEGKVRVGRGEPGDAEVAAAPFVAAGEKRLLPKQAPLPAVEKVSSEALQSALAWRGPLAEFADAPLADVVARFNARNRVQLVIADAELGRRPIGGTFPLNEVEAFVHALELQGEVVGERRGENEIVLRRAR